MRKKKPKAKQAKGREKPVKVAGTFEELIRQSLVVKKPTGGWPKPKG